jgi:small subunit ribosomal protein S6e
MRADLPGVRRKNILLSKSTGFTSNEQGIRRRKLVRGNTVSPDTTQINMTITAAGSKSVEDLLPKKEEKK